MPDFDFESAFEPVRSRAGRLPESVLEEIALHAQLEEAPLTIEAKLEALRAEMAESARQSHRIAVASLIVAGISMLTALVSLAVTVMRFLPD